MKTRYLKVAGVTLVVIFSVLGLAIFLDSKFTNNRGCDMECLEKVANHQ